MDLEEIGLEGKDLTCPKTGTSDWLGNSVIYFLGSVKCEALLASWGWQCS